MGGGMKLIKHKMQMNRTIRVGPPAPTLVIKRTSKCSANIIITNDIGILQTPGLNINHILDFSSELNYHLNKNCSKVVESQKKFQVEF